MSDWIRINGAGALTSGRCREIVVQERVVALFNVEGQFHALDGICPHQGGPLGQGELNGATITCPWHGWQFDATTGANLLNPRIVQPGFEVRQDGQDVLIRLT